MVKWWSVCEKKVAVHNKYHEYSWVKIWCANTVNSGEYGQNWRTVSHGEHMSTSICQVEFGLNGSKNLSVCHSVVLYFYSKSIYFDSALGPGRLTAFWNDAQNIKNISIWRKGVNIKTWSLEYFTQCEHHIASMKCWTVMRQTVIEKYIFSLTVKQTWFSLCLPVVNSASLTTIMCSQSNITSGAVWNLDAVHIQPSGPPSPLNITVSHT